MFAHRFNMGIGRQQRMRVFRMYHNVQILCLFKLGVFYPGTGFCTDMEGWEAKGADAGVIRRGESDFKLMNEAFGNKMTNERDNSNKNHLIHMLPPYTATLVRHRSQSVSSPAHQLRLHRSQRSVLLGGPLVAQRQRLQGDLQQLVGERQGDDGAVLQAGPERWAAEEQRGDGDGEAVAPEDGAGGVCPCEDEAGGVCGDCDAVVWDEEECGDGVNVAGERG
jgi:hypothetical protein